MEMGRGRGSSSHLTKGLSLALLVLSACSHGFTRENVSESKKRGDAVVRALESWRAEHGAYPAGLSELGIEIAPPTAGWPKRWEYRGSADEFTLTFSWRGYPASWFASGTWDCEAGRSEGQAWVEAIERFRREYGEYPRALDELGSSLTESAGDPGDWAYQRLGGQFRLTLRADETCRFLRGWYDDR